MTRFLTYYFMVDYHAGIGEMVNINVINCFNEVLHWSGEEKFSKYIYEGEGADVAFAYIHPCEELRATKGFDIIQRAFINAYV